jgi:hypothetical protein
VHNHPDRVNPVHQRPRKGGRHERRRHTFFVNGIRPDRGYGPANVIMAIESAAAASVG